LSAHPKAALVYGNRQFWSGAPDDNGIDSVSDNGIISNTLIEPPTLLTLVYCDGKVGQPGSDVTFRRRVAIRLGGFEERFGGLFEDQVFLVKLLLNETVFVSSECWLRYRQHSRSCVASAIASGQYKSSRKQFLAWFEGYLIEHGMKGTPVYEAIERS